MHKTTLHLILIGLINVLLVSCHPDKNMPVQLSEMRFTTTDASELFFNNVRKSAYKEEQNKEAGINVYRSKELENSSILLEPVLILNWRHDQAFIILEERDSSFEDEVTFSIGSSQKELLTFDKSHHKDHTKFCLIAYNALLEGDTIYIQNESGLTLYLAEEEHRSAFRKVIFDWLRLVDLR